MVSTLVCVLIYCLFKIAIYVLSSSRALVKLADSTEFDGQTLLRKFYPNNGKILLKANNPDYKDMEIAALDWKSKGKIIGVVVGRTDYRQF